MGIYEKEIGARIKERRLAMGLSQEALANKLGYKSRSSINKIELGHNSFKQSMLEKMAAALDVSPVWLLGMEDTVVSAPHVFYEEKGQVLKMSVAFVDVLEKLIEMYKEGMITAEEFQLAKDKILRDNII